MMTYPSRIPSLIGGEERSTDFFIEKKNPATGELLAVVTVATKEIVKEAIDVAVSGYVEWSGRSVQERTDILRKAVQLIQERQEDIVSLVALETGRSKRQTQGEIAGAINGALYILSQGTFFTETPIVSSNPRREVTLVRTAVGVAALFTPFNSPFVLSMGKMLPALLSGNAVVIKAHELAPYTPILAASIFLEVGVPQNVISVLEGNLDTGKVLAADPRVALISFTGSSKGGAEIVASTAPRLTRVSIEAGGKNPFVVCADADTEKALTDATASITVDNGQRCASTSRLILFEDIYDSFKQGLVDRFSKLTFGTHDENDLGALISEERLTYLLTAVEEAKSRGGVVVYGGKREESTETARGYFMQPTILENISPDDALSQTELFGPIVILYRAKNLDEAITIANNSPYRLSSAIHTKDMKEAKRFTREHGAGVTRINGPTFGSESHMPFGGEGLSGNGWREPGIQALDFYSSLKQVSFDQL